MPEPYLANAAEAEKLASAATSDAEKRVHLEVAALWRELAARKAERIRRAECATAAAQPSSPPADVRIDIDQARARVVITVSGDIDGRIVAEQVSGTFRAQPSVTRMDMVYDLTHLTGGVGAVHMDAIAAAYLAGADAESAFRRTAIVAPDPFYGRWAETLSRQFGREHRAFPNLEAAEPFLSEPMPSRTPPA
jgi:hypothetical protein